MAIQETDIWRMAQLLVTLHGENAPFVAAQRRDALLTTGDLDGRIAWRRVTNAVRALMELERPNSSVVH